MAKTPKKGKGRPRQEVKMSKIYAVRLPLSLENGLKAYCLTNKTKPSTAIREAVKTMLINQLQSEKKR